MSMTVTIINDRYSTTDGSQRKYIDYTISCTNPYTANGEVLSDFSGHFNKEFLGGWTTMVNPSVTVNLAGLAKSCVPRATTASTSTITLQLLAMGFATTAWGNYVDNTTANISNCTFTLRMSGR
jgi:hypothetical protein